MVPFVDLSHELELYFNGKLPLEEDANRIRYMSATRSQWVIRLDSDQVKGPYSTDAVIKMITSGVFSGGEDICAYPDGVWSPLAKQTEFYDALIESLENPVEVDIKKAQKMEAETVIRIIPKKSEDQPNYELPEAIRKIIEEEKKAILREDRGKANESTVLLTPLVISKRDFPIIPVPKKRKKMTQVRDQNLTIQLSDIKKLKHEN